MKTNLKVRAMNKLNCLRRTIVKKFFWVAIATVFFVFQFNTNSASALELDANTRTIVANEAGETVTLSSKEVTEGQRLFNSACTKCHLQGKTKTNNNVSLGVSDLAGAELIAAKPNTNKVFFINIFLVIRTAD